ncbi:MAG: Uma2 family endonuclease, partial [Acidimicrobiales bacterium]
PLLVVEIASTSTAVTDRTLKRAVYEEAGVPSYWLVDPVEPSLTVLELGGGAYREVATVRQDESFGATLPFPVSIMPSVLVG